MEKTTLQRSESTNKKTNFRELHSYQWDGVSFLLDSTSALLADEMGLGKTAQTIAAFSILLKENSDINRVLVVAPASLTLNWIIEIAKWEPSMTVRRVQGDSADRKMYYMLPVPVLIASYEQIREDWQCLSSDSFDLVVLDEAQRIKNRESITALACRFLPRKRSWALSATPLENRSDDVTSILSFLDPSISGDLTQMQISKKLKMMMLRRRKCEVRAELPPIIIQDIQVDLSPQQKDQYDELWTTREKQIRDTKPDTESMAVMLSVITRLKVICNFDEKYSTSSKLSALRLILDEAGQSARIIVFSQFVSTLEKISSRLNFPHELLIGSMSMTERHTVIEKFKLGKTPRLLLISLRAGGVGLNLDEASHVVLFDRWWNPAVEIQAIFRAHRFDRKEPLHVIRFLIPGTIEERIAAIIENKEDLVEKVVDSASNLIASAQTPGTGISRKDILKILEISNRNPELQSR